MTENQPVLPIFDSIEYLEKQNNFSYLSDDYNLQDIKQAQMFLKSYKGSLGTFNAYRREIERLIQWCALITKKALKDLKRDDIERYIEFCQKPPKQWIGTHKPSRFIRQEAIRVPNPEWKPFIATLSKSSHRKGERPTLKDFEFSQVALKQLFAIIGSFYNYLLQEGVLGAKPIIFRFHYYYQIIMLVIHLIIEKLFCVAEGALP